MILDYEIAFWKSFHSKFPEFKALNYAKDESLFEVYQQIKSLPSLYFNRSDDNWDWRRIYKIYHSGRLFRGIPIEVNYHAALLVEKQKDAALFAKRILNYFDECAYVTIYSSEDDNSCEIPISQRNQYIKIEEVRNSKEDKGALRLVRFSWKVNLLLSSDTAMSYNTVKEVNLIINNTETVIKYQYK